MLYTRNETLFSIDTSPRPRRIFIFDVDTIQKHSEILFLNEDWLNE